MNGQIGMRALILKGNYLWPRMVMSPKFQIGSLELEAGLALKYVFANSKVLLGRSNKSTKIFCLESIENDIIIFCLKSTFGLALHAISRWAN